MTVTTAPLRRIPGWIGYGVFSLFVFVALPATQLLGHGAIATWLAIDAPATSWIAWAMWAAAALSVVGALHQHRTAVEPMDAMIPTNGGAVLLAILQVAIIAGLWRLQMPDSTLMAATTAGIAILAGVDIAQRVRFVLQVRCAGGVEQEAQRIAGRIISTQPNDARELIIGEAVAKRDRSRLHWALHEALMDEARALRERENAQGDGEKA